MKILGGLLAVAFTIVVACMIFLQQSGVSLRTAPIIKPSAINADFTNIAQGTFLRLFPDIQQSHYILWGVSQNSGEVQKTLSLLKEKTEQELKSPVHFIYDGPHATPEEIRLCPRPCWILMPPDQAHELTASPWIHSHLKPLDRAYFSITWIPFDRDVEVPDFCQEEKRLDLECLKWVSVREVQRKLKETSSRYFFMRKYLDHDYFLFVENARP